MPSITKQIIYKTPLLMEDEKYNTLKPLLEGVAIAGGAARQAYLNDGSFGSTDIDLYFKSLEDHKAFTKKLKRLFNLKHRVIYKKYSSVKALSFNTSIGKLQLIAHWYDDLIDAIKDFDFTVCQFAILNNEIHYTQEAFEDLQSHTLRYAPYYAHFRGSIVPIRISKYIKKGFIPDEDCWKKLEKQIIQVIKTAPHANQDIRTFAKLGPIPYVAHVDWDLDLQF